jgi:hypothetical protein
MICAYSSKTGGRPISAAEQVVERAVLEHDHDDVIEGIAPVRSRHDMTITPVTNALPLLP